MTNSCFEPEDLKAVFEIATGAPVVAENGISKERINVAKNYIKDDNQYVVAAALLTVDTSFRNKMTPNDLADFDRVVQAANAYWDSTKNPATVTPISGVLLSAINPNQ